MNPNDDDFDDFEANQERGNNSPARVLENPLKRPLNLLGVDMVSHSKKKKKTEDKLDEMNDRFDRLDRIPYYW